MKNKQLTLPRTGHTDQRSEHGGSLKHPQKRKRPLSTRSSMHLVLRSTKAKGERSFRKHQLVITQILNKFAKRHFVQIIDSANVGNHLHLHLRLAGRVHYRAFIRAITSAIAVRICGNKRWTGELGRGCFWDQRPFSRIVGSWREFLNLAKYIEINRWQAIGLERWIARRLVSRGRNLVRLSLISESS